MIVMSKTIMPVMTVTMITMTVMMRGGPQSPLFILDVGKQDAIVVLSSTEVVFSN